MQTHQQLTYSAMFEEESEDEVRKIIMGSASKWYSLNPIPSPLSKACLDVLLHIITRIINLSMASGEVSHNLKETIILPLIKKALLYP